MRDNLIKMHLFCSQFRLNTDVNNKGVLYSLNYIISLHMLVGVLFEKIVIYYHQKDIHNYTSLKQLDRKHYGRKYYERTYF